MGTKWVSEDGSIELYKIKPADGQTADTIIYNNNDRISALSSFGNGGSVEFYLESAQNDYVSQTGFKGFHREAIIEKWEYDYLSERDFAATVGETTTYYETGDKLHIFRVDQTVNTERTAPKTIQLSTSIKAGKYVTFGSFEQDNDTANGSEEIIWRVLEVQDGRALLLSEYVLNALPYCDADEVPSWETSTVRSWLNSDFYNEAFDDTERAMICPTELVTEDNPISVDSTEITTTDSVFLLSTKEEWQYFSKQKQLIAEPTAYAAAQGVYVCSITKLRKQIDRCGWWLRDSCSDDNRAAFISFDGDDEIDGARAAFEHYGVRPAIWVELPEA